MFASLVFFPHSLCTRLRILPHTCRALRKKKQFCKKKNILQNTQMAKQNEANKQIRKQKALQPPPPQLLPHPPKKQMQTNKQTNKKKHAGTTYSQQEEYTLFDFFCFPCRKIKQKKPTICVESYFTCHFLSELISLSPVPPPPHPPFLPPTTPPLLLTKQKATVIKYKPSNAQTLLSHHHPLLKPACSS